ncbi:MAG: Stk1 family PASTA domain-containing Ser/Thr kinase [Defluviitaleaceae bacterium]|nr:Stk1 family PASTA domain-containing Ser/Thr kinase [Defluviitaleaceae bacterium]
MKLTAGQLIAGRYEIDSNLGAGGMAVVYRAFDIKLERYVSLKVLREELAADADFVRRFPVEAMAAAALSHPNIVSIYDYGQDDSIYYIVLEYIDGANLKDMINHYAPFDNDATLGMAIQIADGLAAAHRAGIIHRDIKPQNILVDNSSNAKVADFGIARVARTSTITAGESMGSAHYFSPEQARGGYVDHTTDIYSLGIVIFEMATGQLPFEGDNVVAVALQQINDPMPDMIDINPQISESVARIVYKATAKSPTRRYRNIEEMAEDLKYALTDSSGDFIQAVTEANPTQTISQAEREEIKRRQTPPSNDVKHDDTHSDEYEYDDYDDYDSYEDDYDGDNQNQKVERSKDDKKANRIAIMVGVGLGLIFTVLILLASRSVYGRLRTPRLSPPDVIGMTYSEAVDAAQAARLTIALRDSIFHNEVPEGYIIDQSPVYDYVGMAPGQPIQVTMSLGPSPYTMPDIMGMDIEAVRELLAEFPVEIMEIEREDEAEPGTIIRQDPDKDTPIGEGTMVIVYVSLGMEEAEPSEVAVPNLIGRTQAEALELLRDAGLLAGIVLQAESITFARGLIFGQSPLPGEIVDRESLVGFSVSTGSNIPTPAPATPTPEYGYDDPYDEQDPDDPDDPGQPDYPGYQYPDTPDYPEQPDPDEQPVTTVRNLIIPLWEVPEDTLFVHLRVMRHQQGLQPDEVYHSLVFTAQFPYGIQVEGSGLVMYRVYAIEDGAERFISAHEINFHE